MYFYMYIHIHNYMYIHMYIHIYIYMYTHLYIYMYLHMYTYMRIQMYIYMRIRTSINMPIHMCHHMYIHMYIAMYILLYNGTLYCRFPVHCLLYTAHSTAHCIGIGASFVQEVSATRGSFVNLAAQVPHVGRSVVTVVITSFQKKSVYKTVLR